jgi:ATP-binding cassette subfamily C protein
MQSDVVNRGLSELRRVRRRSRGLYWAVALFSLFANMLMLTGPLYRSMTACSAQGQRKR